MTAAPRIDFLGGGRIGLIGCGRIGRPVARAIRPAAILGQRARLFEGLPVLGDAEAFFAQDFSLVIETAGPEAFRALVPRALERGDVLAVSPLPLADPAVEDAVRRTCARTGHRLRIAPGAIGGLDAIAAAKAAGNASLEVFVELAAGDNAEPVVLFEGSVREAALRHPEGINVAVTAALAGPGLDATRVRVLQPPRGSRGRSMGFKLASSAGTFEVVSRPMIDPAADLHAVAFSVLAVLRGDAGALVVC